MSLGFQFRADHSLMMLFLFFHHSGMPLNSKIHLLHNLPNFLLEIKIRKIRKLNFCFVLNLNYSIDPVSFQAFSLAIAQRGGSPIHEGEINIICQGSVGIWVPRKTPPEIEDEILKKLKFRGKM